MRLSAIHVRALVEAVGLKGVSAGVFLARAGLNAGRLSDSYSWFSVDEFDALMLLALELTRDEAFGLHWGEHSLMIQYDVLPPLISQAKSLQRAIESILRFQPILSEEPEIDFTDHGGRASFRLRPHAASERGMRLREEMMTAGLLRLLKAVGGAARSTLTRVGFTHECPGYRSEYERVFGGLARFGQSACTLEFQYAALDSPDALHNQELHHTLAAQAERVLQRVTADSTYAERLQRLIERRLPEVLQIAEAAQALGMSERSLRRRLTEERVSYTELVKQRQIELACNMLANPAKSLKEVAYEAGFTDQSAFHRAFKRCTGTSPAQYRARATKD